jgi:hypothetical protein
MKNRVVNLPKASHDEAEITFEETVGLGIVVTKQYRSDCECIQWLNRVLARYYNPSEGQPVAQHEFAALTLLRPYGFVPHPLRRGSDFIQMEFAGEPVGPDCGISPAEFRRQCEVILNTFKTLGFRHNDLLPRNVLTHEGRVKIIDFTLSEFGGIEIMTQLPDPNWAIPGQDHRLLTYLPAHDLDAQEG